MLRIFHVEEQLRVLVVIYIGCAVFGYRKASGLGVAVVVPVEKNVSITTTTAELVLHEMLISVG